MLHCPYDTHSCTGNMATHLTDVDFGEITLLEMTLDFLADSRAIAVSKSAVAFGYVTCLGCCSLQRLLSVS